MIFQALGRAPCNYSVWIPTLNQNRGGQDPEPALRSGGPNGHSTPTRNCMLWPLLYLPMSHHTHWPWNTNLAKWSGIHIDYMLAHWILKKQTIRSLCVYRNTLSMPNTSCTTETKLPAPVILYLTRGYFGFCIIKKINYPSYIQRKNSKSRRGLSLQTKVFSLNVCWALVTDRAVLIAEGRKENSHNCLIDGERRRGTLVTSVLGRHQDCPLSVQVKGNKTRWYRAYFFKM